MTEVTSGPVTKTVEFDGVIENAYGTSLETASYKQGFTPVKALAFDGSYEAILNFESIPAKELPDNDDILTLVNNKRKANARQKAMQDALDAAGVVKPTLEGNRDLQIATMVKALVASGKTKEQATQIATAALA